MVRFFTIRTLGLNPPMLRTALAPPVDLAGPDTLQDHHRTRIRRLGGAVLERGVIYFPSTCAHGFSVNVYCGDGATTASFGGLIQDLASLDEALHWAERAFSADHRLRVETIANRPCLWALEKLLPNGGVVEMMSAGLPVFLGGLRKRSVHYLQNRPVKTPHLAGVS